MHYKTIQQLINAYLGDQLPSNFTFADCSIIKLLHHQELQDLRKVYLSITTFCNLLKMY